MPPYTTRSLGRSATSGSRLFMIMRSGASVSQLRALKVCPRGARIVGRTVGLREGWIGAEVYLSRQLGARLLSGPERARELVARTRMVQGRKRGNTVVGPRSAQDQQAGLRLRQA